MSEMVTHPGVSFVIAAYNAEATLRRAIDSALAQIGVSVEVIVVDDCSTDATAEIASSYPDERVRSIRHLHNRGPGAARNTGITAAKGEWVAVLDSDDSIHPNRLQRMIARAAATDADIVVDNLQVVPMEGGRPRRMFRASHLKAVGELTLATFIQSNIIFRSTFNYGYMKPIFARRFLLGHGLRFDEGLRIGEDYMLLASALACGGKCAVEPHAGYVYHLRESSISRVLEKHHLDAMLVSDMAFVERFPLEGQAATAQRRRTRSLKEARSFISLVEQIKKRSIGGILKTAIRNPAAVRHLRLPIAVRVRRLVKTVGAKSTAPGVRLQKGKSS